VLETACEITGARYAALGILDRERRALDRFITRGIDADTHRTGRVRVLRSPPAEADRRAG